MALTPSGAPCGFRAQGELVEFANRLQRLLDLAVVVEPPPHLGHLWAAQADLTVLAAGVVDVEDPLEMALATGTDGAALGMEGAAMEQGAAEDLAEGGELGEEAVEF